MRLKKYITELSMKKDTKIKYNVSNNKFSATITLENGDKFIINATGLMYVLPPPTDLDKFFDNNLGRYKTWEIDFEDEKGRIATIKKEKGVAIELFAAIEEYFKKFLKSKNPEIIEFVGIGESKAKLFERLSKKIEKAGYTDKYGKGSIIKKAVLVRNDLLKL